MRAFVNTLETKDSALKRAAEYQPRNDAGNRNDPLSHMIQPYRSEDEWWRTTAERAHGIPKDLTALQDDLFLLLPEEAVMPSLVGFYSAIAEGADLSAVVDRFMQRILTDHDLVKKHTDIKGRAVLANVAMLYARRAMGGTVTRKEWITVREIAKRLARHDYKATERRYSTVTEQVRDISSSWIENGPEDAGDVAGATARLIANWQAEHSDPEYSYPSWEEVHEQASFQACRTMADKLIEIISRAPVTPDPTPNSPQP